MEAPQLFAVAGGGNPPPDKMDMFINFEPYLMISVQGSSSLL